MFGMVYIITGNPSQTRQVEKRRCKSRRELEVGRAGNKEQN